MKEGRSDAALALSRQRPQAAAYLHVPFFNYHEAEVFFQKGQYAAAVAGYRQFLNGFRGVNFIKDACYKQFLAEAFRGNADAARRAYTQARERGEAFTEADKAARKATEKPFSLPSALQTVLLKSRYATDGGYYATALQLLQPYGENDFATASEKAEYHYRLARIYHRSGAPDKALPAYEAAVRLSQSGYIGAAACLQLGYLFQQRGQLPQARRYWQKALAYPRHEHKNSIDNKARAALTQSETPQQ